MIEVEAIKGVDIYLLDQMLKGNLRKEHRVLDMGCGSGRNVIPLMNFGINCVGVDPNSSVIDSLKNSYPKYSENFLVSSILKYKNSDGFDFIICIAVLHFAENHEDFNRQFAQLVSMLNEVGILFVRMTSDIGFDKNNRQETTGVYQIPDGTNRYLITRCKIDELLKEHSLSLVEPVKTVNVDGQRFMTTLVFRK